jgi:outer membrane protein assembly factor BamB
MSSMDRAARLVLRLKTLKELWRFQSKGGKQNVNNVSSPAIAGKWLHFGTTAGIYYVLDRDTGAVVKPRSTAGSRSSARRSWRRTACMSPRSGRRCWR